MNQIINSVRSTSSILGRYPPLDSNVITMKGGYDTRRGFGYLYRPRKVVFDDLLHVSNSQITRVTIHTNRRDAFYFRNLPSNAEAQTISCQSEGADCNTRSRDNIQCMLCQGDIEP